MKKLILIPVSLFVLMLGINLKTFAQQKVNVVKSIPITVTKINDVVKVKLVEPIEIGKIDKPIVVSEDYRNLQIEYSEETVSVTPGNNVIDLTQPMLNKKAGDGWELISCTPYLMNATASPASQLLFIFMRKRVK